MSLLSATWWPLVSTGGFLEPLLAQLHKVFYRKLSVGPEGSASLAALHSDHLLLSKTLDPGKGPALWRLNHGEV